MIWLVAVASNDVISNVYGSYMIGSALLLMLCLAILTVMMWLQALVVNDVVGSFGC